MARLAFGLGSKLAPGGSSKVGSWPGPGAALNAFYDGVRCATGEIKTYARYSGDAWHPVENPEWQPLGQAKTRYSLALARQAICRSGAPRGTTGEMVQALKKPHYID